MIEEASGAARTPGSGDGDAEGLVFSASLREICGQAVPATVSAHAVRSERRRTRFLFSVCIRGFPSGIDKPIISWPGPGTHPASVPGFSGEEELYPSVMAFEDFWLATPSTVA